MKTLTRSFYRQPTVDVARGLLGQVLAHGETSGRIIEVEAYLGQNDLAAHSARGITPRTQVIFGSPGHAYVYLIYGMYECLNVVAEPDGVPGCVLIRALTPLTGLDRMRERRGTGDLAGGPGKLTQALGITRAQNGADLTRGPLRILDAGPHQGEILVTPRIGISQSRDLPLRFVLKGER
ncbi:MAG: DNA-3-methyladenine glycosylase [Bryobacteraceae bacterium]|nr:DNA-3-methyladenine glycosylase [Bryobacteraceae bacterium]